MGSQSSPSVPSLQSTTLRVHAEPEQNPVMAIFSKDRTYRYALFRTVGASDRTCLFVGLNPSTADEFKDDPTVRRCIGFARRFGCGHLAMANLFAYRATDPKVMKAAKDPFGPENSKALEWQIDQASLIIAAWGTHGTHLGANQIFLSLFDSPWRRSKLHYLRMSPGKQPHHPLYLPGDLDPIRWPEDRFLKVKAI